MAYELDSEMREGLRAQYRAMSDGELLGMAARPVDLTDMAQEILRAEMQSRRLEGNPPQPLPDPFGLSRPNVMPKPQFGMALERGKVALITLADAFTVGEACDYLEEAGIEVEVRDATRPGMRRGTHADGSGVRMELVVAEPDSDRAVKLLREKMGLFPKEEIAEPDMPEDDGTKITLGVFARREDAEDVARVLKEAGIWNIVKPNPEGTVEDEDAFLVGVKEIDMVRAGELVEKALGLPEG